MFDINNDGLKLIPKIQKKKSFWKFGHNLRKLHKKMITNKW